MRKSVGYPTRRVFRLSCLPELLPGLLPFPMYSEFTSPIFQRFYHIIVSKSKRLTGPAQNISVLPGAVQNGRWSDGLRGRCQKPCPLPPPFPFAAYPFEAESSNHSPSRGSDAG